MEYWNTMEYTQDIMEYTQYSILEYSFFLFFFFILSFWSIVNNDVLVTGIQQGDLVIPIKYPFFFKLFSHSGYYRIQSQAPMLYSRSWLALCFKYSSVYISISSSIPTPSLSPIPAIIDTPTSTHHNHPKSIVYTRVCSQCYKFCGFGQMYNPQLSN